MIYTIFLSRWGVEEYLGEVRAESVAGALEEADSYFADSLTFLRNKFGHFVATEWKPLEPDDTEPVCVND